MGMGIEMAVLGRGIMTWVIDLDFLDCFYLNIFYLSLFYLEIVQKIVTLIILWWCI